MRFVTISTLCLLGLTGMAAIAASQYRLKAFSLNSGGRPTTGGNYRQNGSLGQIAAGQISGGNYQAGVGFWTRSLGAVSGVGVDTGESPPIRSSLGNSIPNPFHPPLTTIPFEVGLSESARGEGITVSCFLQIYDVQGRLVRTLVSSPYAPGSYRVSWDSRNDGGDPVPSGVYFYTLQAGSFRSTKRLVFIR